MDDIVKRAMAKWPDVPGAFGWLGLDRRGNWLVKGDRLANALIANFISRNYAQDDARRWFFQNGPQRVYVTLDYTPLVYRITSAAGLGIEAHTGQRAERVERAWIDDGGIVLIETELGPGLIDDRDLDALLPCFSDARGAPLPEDAVGNAIERLQHGHSADLYFHYSQVVAVAAIKAAAVPDVLGFVQTPVPSPDSAEAAR
jgi:hypothetical protein